MNLWMTKSSFSCLCEVTQFWRARSLPSASPVSASKICSPPVCTHIWGTGIRGYTALCNETLTPSSGGGNAVHAGITQNKKQTTKPTNQTKSSLPNNSRSDLRSDLCPSTSLFIYLFDNPRMHLLALVLLSVFSFMPGCLPTWALLRACFSLWKECVCLSAWLNQELFL